jgi:hypothetical protein
MKNHITSRRTVIKSSIFGTLAVATPAITYAKSNLFAGFANPSENELYYRYPAIGDAVVSDFVGAAHFDYDKVKEMVSARPELARATWDWAWGDWESAVGAAGHMGRRDIANLLIEHGARPSIFVFAMLGELSVVKSTIEASPGIQSTAGPHGISLLQHAKIALRSEDLTAKQRVNVEEVLHYLESLGNADRKTSDITLAEGDSDSYVGDYRYGEGEDDIFEVRFNSRRHLLTVSRKGNFGSSMEAIAPQEFELVASPSVKVKFSGSEGTINTVTVEEPDLVLNAQRIS